MQKIINEDILKEAKVLWDYHCIKTDLSSSDFILALGSHDERVAHHSADLSLQGLAPFLVTSGGFGKVTKLIWGTSEGEHFASVARNAGVSSSKILIENTATNTGENFTKSRELLKNKGIRVSRGILVTKPYMQRRAYATACKQWNDIQWQVSAPHLSFEEYPDEEVTQEKMIELMVGDLQRIKVYAEQGFQIPQTIPSHVWESYQKLVNFGFDTYVIK